MSIGPGAGRTDDEASIRALVGEFRVAVERGIPREAAALMCAEEAEQFLDDVADPDYDGPPVETIGEPSFELSGIRIFGGVALARITHAPDDFATLFFRHEAGRWTMCADAADDLSLDQLENAEVRPLPEAATRLMRTVHHLRGRPIGGLTVEDHRCLLLQREGVEFLLPRAVDRLHWDPLVAGDLYPGDLLAAALRVGPEHWARDPVARTRMRHIIDKVRDLGDPAAYGAPHQELRPYITDFLAHLPDE